MNRRENSGQNTSPIRHRPDGVPPGTPRTARRRQFAPGNQQAGQRHGHAADQEVPRAAQADQSDAAGGQREAEQGDDHAQADQGG
jgi:hypothetical protein